MGRLLLACVLGCAIFAGVAYQLGYIGVETYAPAAKDQAKRAAPAPDLGATIFKAAPWPAAPAAIEERRVDPVVVLGNMAVLDRPEMAAQVPGQIMFIGEEVPDGALQVAGAAAFLAEPF